ncbi:MAG: RNA polymerase sigma factor [Planctomycetales bacterium]|nr:RNA polymerase sigma factor [Planctomycetales bacterium]
MDNAIDDPATTRPGLSCAASTLMERLAAGDKTAMNELVAEYGPALHRLVGRLTGWASDADDLLQEVLITAWRKANRYHGSGSLEGWLRRLAINVCHSRLRALGKLSRRFQSSADLDAVPTGEPHTPTAREEALAATFGKLRQADRSVLVLYYMENLSGEEVAAALNIRAEAFHARLSRARARLRELIESHERAHPER